MKQSDLPVILIANDVLSGRIVVWGNKGFSRLNEKSFIANTLEEAEGLKAIGEREFAHLNIVDPDLVSVSIENNHATPKHLRDKIKLLGPTIALGLDKIEGGLHVSL